MTNARGKATNYAYDALNRLTSVTDPLSRTTSFQYDAASNLTQRTDARGLVTKYFYDALDRNTRTEHWNGGAMVDAVTYAYDAVGNRTQMADPTGTTAYVPDGLNRLASVTFPGNKTVSYQYDTLGNRTRVTYPDGKYVNYGFDTAHNLTSLADWGGRTSSFAYNAAGALTTVTYPSATGLTSTRAYDNADRLTSITNKKGTNTLSFFNYSLNAVGNRTQVADNSGTTTFGYDNLHRLTSVAYPGGPNDSYSYDAVGNRLTKNGISYTYDNADQMTNAGGVAYGYDGNGNQTSRGADAFTWDHENRLTSATVAGAQTTNTYNGDGLRMSRTSGGQTANYVWDVGAGLAVILQEGTNTYVYGATGLLYWVDGAANPTYRLTDGLGSTVNVCDAAGNGTATWAYDVFGAVRSHTGGDAEFTFTGEQNDPNGLEYLRARYYDPVVGRFLSRDPLPALVFSPLTLNPYAYASNNPANLTDPTGMSEVGGDLLAIMRLCDQLLGGRCLGGGGGGVTGPGIFIAAGAGLAIALFYDVVVPNDKGSNGTAHPPISGEPAVTPPDPNDPFRDNDRIVVARGQEFRLTDHAILRMEERALSREMIAETIEHYDPVTYWYKGELMAGYWNPTAGIFVGTTGDGTVTTVMYGSGVDLDYILSLLASMP